MVAIAFAGECFGAFVYPVAVFVAAVLRRYGREGFGDAAVESWGFGFFVAHDLVVVDEGGCGLLWKKSRDFARRVLVLRFELMASITGYSTTILMVFVAF